MRFVPLHYSAAGRFSLNVCWVKLYLKSSELGLYLIGCDARAMADFYVKEEHDEIPASGF